MNYAMPILKRVLCDEGRGTFANGFHRREDGMIAWVTLLAVLFFLVLGQFIFNVSMTVNMKMNTQNAADAIGYSGSVWNARGMNAVTASNHFIGELMGIYVMHHALGGKYLDENSEPNDTAEMQLLNEAVTTSYGFAQNARPIPATEAPKTQLEESPIADVNSTIYQAEKTLKIALAVTYSVHAASMALHAVPYIGYALATAVQALCLAFEIYIFAEALSLRLIETFARTTKQIKNTIPTAIVGVRGYQGMIEIQTKARRGETAREIAKENGVTGFIVGPGLPIEDEEYEYVDDKSAQITRATHPWVYHWRTGINRFLNKPLVGMVSQAAKHYAKYTSQYTLEACEWMRAPSDEDIKLDLTVENRGAPEESGDGEKGRDFGMLVMEGLNDARENNKKADKSYEEWNRRDQGNKSALIDSLFCHIGVAHFEAPPTIGAPSIFRQTNPKGMVCVSQTIFYNANRQVSKKRRRGDGKPQPKVGWDTLNWGDDNRAPEWVQKGEHTEHTKHPNVVLNWQAKLTPITRNKLYGSMPAVALINRPIFNILMESHNALEFTNH